MLIKDSSKKTVSVDVDEGKSVVLEVDRNCINPVVLSLCPRCYAAFAEHKDRKAVRLEESNCYTWCDICLARVARNYVVFEYILDKAA